MDDIYRSADTHRAASEYLRKQICGGCSCTSPSLCSACVERKRKDLARFARQCIINSGGDPETPNSVIDMISREAQSLPRNWRTR